MAVIRLSKAVREFNVGMSTIVEFLHKKGFDVEATPNTKLSAEMYDLLNIEYKGEKYVKEKALSKDVSSSKRETITIDDVIHKEEKTEFYEEEEDIFIRGVNVEIDQNFKKAIAPKVRKEEKKAEKEPEKVEVKEKPEKGKKEETTPPVEEKMVSEVEKKEEKPEEPLVTEPKEETVAEPKTTAEPPVEEKAETQPEPKEPEKEPEPEQTATTETEKPEEEEESKSLKVLGKIDLSQINEKTKPPKKSAKEKRLEREKKKKAEQEQKAAQQKKTKEKKETEEKVVARKEEKPETVQPEAEKAKTEEPAPVAEPPKEKNPDNFIKTEVEKLQGPSIIGKIELPVEKKPDKKKPVASSTDDKLDRKSVV